MRGWLSVALVLDLALTVAGGAPWRATPPHHQRMSLTASADGVGFTVSVDDDLWLAGYAPAVHVEGVWYSATLPSPSPAVPAHDPLVLQQSRLSFSGVDVLGSYTAWEYDWLAGTTRVTTGMRAYHTLSAVVFSTKLPDGASNTNTSYGRQGPPRSNPSTRFPSFSKQLGEAAGAQYISWQGTMTPCTGALPFADAQYGGVDNGPIVLFKGNASQTLVLSDLNNFMTAQHNVSDVDVVFGSGGELEYLPQDYLYETIVFAGSGVINTILEWGSVLQQVYRTKKIYDLSLHKLGYWTDNGAYYYYFRFPPTSANEPQEALEALDESFSKLKLPVHYYQLDAWWYRCDGWNACIEDFVPNNSSAIGPYFKDGLLALKKKLGNKPWHLYHNYFCPKNNYTQYDFVLDDTGSFVHINPSQALKFYTHVWQQGKEQGMFATELDYQSTSYNDMHQFRTMINAASDWLLGMGQAAESLGIPIQYCMSYPRYLLQALLVPSATNARGSNDYQTSMSNLLNVGFSAPLIWALGMAPSKDNFWTTGPQQTGPPLNEPDTHANPLLHTIVATLSMGPVGFSDRVGDTNVEYVMATCNKQGDLLQPSRPAMPIDAKFNTDATRPVTGQIWTTHADVGSWTTHYALTFQEPGFQLRREDFYPALDPGVEYVYRSWSSTPCLDAPLEALPFEDEVDVAAPVPGYCHAENDTDQVGGVAVPPCPASGLPNVTEAECCSMCFNLTACESFVYDPAQTLCWLVAGSTGTCSVPNRVFGCVQRTPQALVAKGSTISAKAGSCLLSWPAAADHGPIVSTRTGNCTEAFANGTLASELIGFHPVVHGFALIGEQDKFVSVSPGRFAFVEASASALRVGLVGAPNEVVHVAAMIPSASAGRLIRVVPVTISALGNATVTFISAS